MQFCLKQPNRSFMINKVSLPISGHCEDPNFKDFRDF
jgi:hypothetical protein